MQFVSETRHCDAMYLFASSRRED
ncbi:hypothetical protein IEO21_05627 [Rhodonia placenta]|uniref:Uncharacterized protein n=1 Tax=Rhodonia placenta TaxID=104341 RepID=A0A8H7U1G2_9APHY|nr:hypothetical protein IEO21_05627 [Postia placenta]